MMDMKMMLEGKMAGEAAKFIVDYAHKGLKKRAMLDTKKEKHGSKWMVEMERRLVHFTDAEKALLMMAIMKECAAIDVAVMEVA